MVSVRLPALLLTLAGLGLVSTTGYAQPATPSNEVPPAVKAATTPAASSASTTSGTARADAPAPRRNRAISPEVAAQLAANTPKYEPPPPKPEPKPEEQLVDLRDIDKPRNGIIRLPEYIVQEQKPAVLSERAVNTAKGLRDLAMQRYISEFDRALSRIPLPFVGGSVADRALAMYTEDERLQNMAALNDAANTVSKSDPAAGEYVRRETQRAYMRTSDFGWSGGNNAGSEWQSDATAAVRAAGSAPGER